MSDKCSTFAQNLKNMVTMKSLKEFFEKEPFDTMLNDIFPYYRIDYLQALKSLTDVRDVSPTHPRIMRYVNDSVDCLRFFPTLKIAEDWFIVRMRKGWHKDLEEEYSYPHDTEVVQLGRANLPKNPMFYGSITSVSNNILESSRINAMEIADEAFENGHCRMRVTMSGWRIKSPLLVYPVVHPFLYGDLSEETNQLVSQLKIGYEKHREEWIKEKTIDNLTLQINDEIYKFWSEEFQKHITDGNYHKTAYFTKIMLNEQHQWSKIRKIYDGILYPSHNTYGRIGCNIAIRPDVVDDQLELMVKGKGTLYVNRQSTKIKYLLQPESYKVNFNGEWIEENILEQTPYNEEKLCNDLCIKSVEELEWIE